VDSLHGTREPTREQKETQGAIQTKASGLISSTLAVLTIRFDTGVDGGEVGTHTGGPGSAPEVQVFIAVAVDDVGVVDGVRADVLVAH
jgi:hypothetical protein